MHSSLAFLGLAATAQAATHDLIFGTFGTAFLYTAEFDDEALTLSLKANTTVADPSSWLALSNDKKTLFGNSYTGLSFMSYSIGDDATSFVVTGSVAVGEECPKPIYQVQSTVAPYNVYADCFGSGSSGIPGYVMSVDADGALASLVQNYTYASDSGVHGTAISPDGKFIYGADDSANTIWTHSIDGTTGEVTYVDDLAGPSTDSGPRHAAVHPNGTYLYIVLEGSNEVAQYSLDQETGLPTMSPNTTWPLTPEGKSDEDYWSDEVAVSVSAQYLWATSRARNDTNTGYISAFKLDESGAITTQLFLLPTTSSGGYANAVTPSSFSDRIVAVTDSSVGFLEIWEMTEDETSASAVAHLDAVDTETANAGCCANAVWFS